MRRSTLPAAVFAMILGPIAAAEQRQPRFTDDFPIEDCAFVPRGGNAFSQLVPGRQLYLSNQQCVATGECDELEEVWITVLPQKRTIVLKDDGHERRVTTRVVEEVETTDGELVEISRNFFATCRPANDVYYFGEDVDIYKDGKVVSHEGQWLAGRGKAEPGMIMPDSAFLLGTRYYQEIAPGVALDRAEHVKSDLDVQTPAGAFEDCIKVEETTPLEPGEKSIKLYCPGVGLIADGDLILQAVYDPRSR
jgi:hypothetical protein